MLNLKSILVLIFLFRVVKADTLVSLKIGTSVQNIETQLSHLFGRMRDTLSDMWKWLEFQAHQSMGGIRSIRHYFVSHSDSPLNIKMANSIVSEDYIPPNVPKQDNSAIESASATEQKPTEIKNQSQTTLQEIKTSTESTQISDSSEKGLHSQSEVEVIQKINDEKSTVSEEISPEKVAESVNETENQSLTVTSKNNVETTPSETISVEDNSSVISSVQKEEITNESKEKITAESAEKISNDNSNNFAQVDQQNLNENQEETATESVIPEKLDVIETAHQTNQDIVDNFVKKSSLTSNMYEQQNIVILFLTFFIMMMIIYFCLLSKSHNRCPTIIIGDIQGTLKTPMKK